MSFYRRFFSGRRSLSPSPRPSRRLRSKNGSSSAYCRTSSSGGRPGGWTRRRARGSAGRMPAGGLRALADETHLAHRPPPPRAPPLAPQLSKVGVFARRTETRNHYPPPKKMTYAARVALLEEADLKHHKGVGGKLLSASHFPFPSEQGACLAEHNKHQPGAVVGGGEEEVEEGGR